MLIKFETNSLLKLLQTVIIDSNNNNVMTDHNTELSSWELFCTRQFIILQAVLIHWHC